MYIACGHPGIGCIGIGVALFADVPALSRAETFFGGSGRSENFSAKAEVEPFVDRNMALAHELNVAERETL